MSMSETSLADRVAAADPQPRCHPGEAKSAPARSLLLPPLQEFYLPVVDTEMIGYIRKAVATTQAKAAVRAALEEAASFAHIQRQYPSGGANTENYIRAMITRLDAEEPKP